MLKQFADSFIGITNSGNIGIGRKLINKTGAASIKGTVVSTSTTTDFAFMVAVANCDECIGIVYTNGVADGDPCLIIEGFSADVLLKDATASAHGNWAGMSDVAGRADMSGASPPAAPQHFEEIGHCLETKGANTDVLAEADIHFL